MAFVVRIVTNELIEYVRIPSRGTRVLSFRTPDIHRAQRFQRSKASEIACRCAIMNPDARVDFIDPEEGSHETR